MQARELANPLGIVVRRLQINWRISMLKRWVKLLPFFIVEIIAKKHGERFIISEAPIARSGSMRTVVCPYNGVWIEVNYKQRIIDAEIDRLHK